jgi:hypothetical protein
MDGVGLEPSVTPAFFGSSDLREQIGRAPARRAEPLAGPGLRSVPVPAPPPLEEDPHLSLSEEIQLPHGTAPVMPPAFTPPMMAPPPVIDLSRLEAAVDRLRMLSDRLTAEVRADAVEVAIMLARKIVEGEITVNVDRLLSTVRSAVRRLGESRRITVRLCPQDAEAINNATSRNMAELSGGGVALIEVVAEPSFGRGDCVVDGDLGSVDARLDTRLHELRRALLDGAAEEQAV